MDAVDVVAACHLLADIRKVVGGLCRLGVHISVCLYLYDVARHLAAQALTSECVPLSHGHCHNPCVCLHATLVALVDGKAQRVVTWALARMSGQTSVPRLDVGGIDDGAAYARLQQYGVDARLLQAVKYGAQFVFLLLY